MDRCSKVFVNWVIFITFAMTCDSKLEFPMWWVFAVNGQYDQQFFCQYRCCYCRRCCCCYQRSSDISLNHFLLLVMLRRSNLTLKYTTDAYAHFSEQHAFIDFRHINKVLSKYTYLWMLNDWANAGYRQIIANSKNKRAPSIMATVQWQFFSWLDLIRS